MTPLSGCIQKSSWTPSPVKIRSGVHTRTSSRSCQMALKMVRCVERHCTLLPLDPKACTPMDMPSSVHLWSCSFHATQRSSMPGLGGSGSMMERLILIGTDRFLILMGIGICPGIHVLMSTATGCVAMTRWGTWLLLSLLVGGSSTNLLASCVSTDRTTSEPSVVKCPAISPT